MFRIVILEDNATLSKHLAETIEKHLTLAQHSSPVNVTILSSAHEIAHIDLSLINILFCDIDLGGPVTGFEVAQKVKVVSPDAYVIFITGHLEYLMQAFKIHAFDFLPKPITKKTIIRCLDDVQKDYQHRQNLIKKSADAIDVKIGPIINRIETDSIILIEKQGNKLIIYSLTGVFSFYDTLDAIHKRLNSHLFIRAHKGFLVNQQHIKTIDYKNKVIKLSQAFECPIGESYKKNLTNDRS